MNLVLGVCTLFENLLSGIKWYFEIFKKEYTGAMKQYTPKKVESLLQRGRN